MARMKKETAFAAAVFDDFPGISGIEVGSREKEGNAAEEMVNFRPKMGGGIEKRCGYGAEMTLPASPRATFSGFVGGRFEAYFLVGGKLYRRDEDDEYGYGFVTRCENETGDATLFAFLGDLWLLCGGKCYLLKNNALVEAEGYVPLYGRNWSPQASGEVYEPENRLTPRIRLHYRNDGGESTVYFGRKVISVDGLMLDGVPVDAGGVTLDGTGYRCSCEDFTLAREIELLVTLGGMPEGGDLIRSAKRVEVFGSADERSVFCFGGEGTSEFYGSRAVSEADAARSDEITGGVGGCLYFPVTEGRYIVDAPVTAVLSHDGRLLVFTAVSTWALERESDGSCSSLVLHSSLGCDHDGAAVLCRDVPVTYCGGKLWKWNVRNSGTSSAEAFSDALKKRVAALQIGAISMEYYREKDELWIMPADGQCDEVIVYGAKKDTFYTFTGIPYGMLLPSSGDTRFLCGAVVYGMSDLLYMDGGTEEICACYRTTKTALGYPERTKRLLRFLLFGDPDGGLITVRMIGERGQVFAADLSGDATASGTPVYDGRASMGRFRFLTVEFRAEGEARQSLSSLTVTARR